MDTYFVSFKKNTATEKLSVRKGKHSGLMDLSNWAFYGKKKSTLIENQELHNFNNM